MVLFGCIFIFVLSLISLEKKKKQGDLTINIFPFFKFLRN